jgi:hypothetical protein
MNEEGEEVEDDSANVIQSDDQNATNLAENVLLDSTGSTFQHILDTFKRDVRDFEENGEVSDELHNALYDYYFDDMPYGTKKARDGDPYEWVADRFGADLGIDGYGGRSPGMPDEDYGMERESVGDYADEYQDSLSGMLKIAGVPAKQQPAPDYMTGVDENDNDSSTGILPLAAAGGLGYAAGSGALDGIGSAIGSAIGGLIGEEETDEGWKGQLAGGTAGTLAGGALGAVGGPIGAAVGSALGGTAGQMIGDKLGGQEETDEAIDPTNPRDYEIPTVQRRAQGQAPLTRQDIKQKDRKAEFDFYKRAHGKPHPDSVADESRSPLAGQYGHSGKMKEVSKDVSFLDRLKELSGMKK